MVEEFIGKLKAAMDNLVLGDGKDSLDQRLRYVFHDKYLAQHEAEDNHDHDRADRSGGIFYSLDKDTPGEPLINHESNRDGIYKPTTPVMNLLFLLNFLKRVILQLLVVYPGQNRK